MFRIKSILTVIVLVLSLSTNAADTPGDAALSSLQAALEKGELWGDTLASQDFAKTPLTKEQAAKARELLWKSHAARIAKEREPEITANTIKHGTLEMPIWMKTFGEKPEAGWSLWISMHGGGGAPKEINDQQWENQKRLYKLEEGIYLAPRAPTNTWNLWHEGHIDTMYARIIEDLIVLKQVDPDRIYIMGYSAGGDGVYQLGPRMADYLAAASMMAGHPNDANPLSLRNIGFSIQCGANDAAYDRNKVCAQWIDKLDELQRADPKGYVHFGQMHEGKGHWMDRQDAAVLPWMAAIKRNPIPEKVVWRQSGRTHDRFYWLAVPASEKAVGGSITVAERAGQTVNISQADQINAVAIRFDDRMVNLDQPVRVTFKDKTVFEGVAPRTIATIMKTLNGRGDPKLMFDAEVEVKIPKVEEAPK